MRIRLRMLPCDSRKPAWRLAPHRTGSLTIATDRSGYQPSPHPSGFSSPLGANSRIEKSGEIGALNDIAINSHIGRDLIVGTSASSGRPGSGGPRRPPGMARPHLNANAPTV